MYLREIVMSEMPSDLACSYIWPSTSLDTALVHSIPNEMSAGEVQCGQATYRPRWQTWVDDNIRAKVPSRIPLESRSENDKHMPYPCDNKTYPLLLPSTQHIPPLLDRPPPTFSLDEIPQMSRFQDHLQLLQPLFRVPPMNGIKLAQRLWIDHLLQQRTRHHVRALWNDEYTQSWRPVRGVGVRCGTGDACTGTAWRPETRQDARDGSLPYAIGACDHEVHARVKGKIQRSDEGRSRSREMVERFHILIKGR
jgi:hypothetical protein